MTPLKEWPDKTWIGLTYNEHLVLHAMGPDRERTLCGIEPVNVTQTMGDTWRLPGYRHCPECQQKEGPK